MKGNKPRVAFFTAERVQPFGTVQLRCTQPAEYLRERSIPARVADVYVSAPGGGSVLFLHRCKADRFTLNLRRLAATAGVPVIYDTDDLLFGEESAAYLAERRGQTGLAPESRRDMMRLCDAVTVSTRYLAQRAAKHHSQVFLLRNALSWGYLAKAAAVAANRPQPGREVVFGYLSGSPTHGRDFATIEADLCRLLRDLPSARLLIVGPLDHGPDLASFGARVERRDWVAYEHFPRLFSEIDVNLVPLEQDEPFCEAKSELKLIEAGACGVPSIATATGTHREAVALGVDSILIGRSDSWYAALRAAAEAPDRLRRIGESARTAVFRHYTPAVRGAEYEDVVRAVLEEHLPARPSLRHHMAMLALSGEIGARHVKRALRARAEWATTAGRALASGLGATHSIGVNP